MFAEKSENLKKYMEFLNVVPNFKSVVCTHADNIRALVIQQDRDVPGLDVLAGFKCSCWGSDIVLVVGRQDSPCKFPGPPLVVYKPNLSY